jgi:hypothetical protein
LSGSGIKYSGENLMWQKIREYAKTEVKEMILAAVCLVLVVAAFMAYLKFIGLPMTRARNLYNQGMLLYSVGNKQAAHDKFRQSLEYWQTPEAQKMLQSD